MFPRSDFADIQVAPGQVVAIEGRTLSGCRHVLAIAGLRPHPWTVTGFGRRRTNGQPYAMWKEATHLAIKAALIRADIGPFPPRVPLGIAMSFGARMARRGAEQRSTSVLSWDIRNLEKALEDALKPCLYADDKQIRFTGPGMAMDTADDWICAHVWEGGAWEPAWTDYTVPPLPEAKQEPNDRLRGLRAG